MTEARRIKSGTIKKLICALADANEQRLDFLEILICWL